MTVKEALNVQDRTVSYRDAEVLLHAVLGVHRGWLYTHPEAELTEEQIATYQAFLKRREQNEPVAYITGRKEFYGREFKTDARALIPRPETEELIDRAMDWLPKQFTAHLKATNKPCPLRILELGTGSGNIAVTLFLELAASHTPAEIIATDISEEALDLARENFAALSAENTFPPISLRFLPANLFDHPVIEERHPFDLIIANLPYVPETWKQDPAAQSDVIFHEPAVALFGGEDGLTIYRQFFKQASAFLSPDGHILIEFDDPQAKDLQKLAGESFPEKKITIYPDYAQLDRVLEISPRPVFQEFSVEKNRGE